MPAPRTIVATTLLVTVLSACSATASTPGASSTGSTPPPGSATSESPSPAAGSIQPSPAETAPPAVSHPGVAMPNPAFTPGETFEGVTVQQVCTSGYASSVRHVTASQYHEVYGEYGIPYPQPSGTYELDHLVPLELGGDNSDRNLWPEAASPTPGFHQKDRLEDALHAMVCSGRIALAEAQHEIATDWYAAYLRYVAG